MDYYEGMSKLVKLSPHVVETVWGGSKLAKLKNWNISKKIGETWEVSTHSKGPSKISGIDLSNFVSLSYLVKFIDTSDNLSIQVHPDDDYAEQFQEKGKTECWLILACEQNAGIFLGLKTDVTKKEFKTAIDNGLAVDKFLNFIPVAPGDFFYVPAGTIHAIGRGVTLCEVQQSSGITYRVWDWNRKGLNGEARELHIDQAMEVLNFESRFNQNVLAKAKYNLFEQKSIVSLADHTDFKVQLMSLNKSSIELNLKSKESIIVLNGEIKIDDLLLKNYESSLVEQAGMVNITSIKQSHFLLVSE